MKPALTPIEEDELLSKVELRDSLTDKRLCERYGIARSTLWSAIERAKARREARRAAATEPDMEPDTRPFVQGMAILA